jgi:hypothetical protein
MMTADEDASASLAQPETAPPVASNVSVKPSSSKTLAEGTILEAAFVDPAYPWPPVDGQGRNAIELQATIQLMQVPPPEDDERSLVTTESLRQRMVMPEKPQTVEPPKQRWWQCCRSADEVVVDTKEYEQQRMAALQAQQEYAQLQLKRQNRGAKTDSINDDTATDDVLSPASDDQRYSRVPEGILVYRLDTSTRQLKLMSPPHAETNLVTLITDMVITQASASSDPSRRGMDLTGEDGRTYTLVACEQRTAIAWLEAMHLMCAKNDRKSRLFGTKHVSTVLL